MTIITIEDGRAAIEAREARQFRATVRGRFLEIPRVKKLTDIDPIEFLRDYDINAYLPFGEEDALMVLADDYEITSRWARGDYR
jgi:hypothetical protein